MLSSVRFICSPLFRVDNEPPSVDGSLKSLANTCTLALILKLFDELAKAFEKRWAKLPEPSESLTVYKEPEAI